MKNRGLRFVRTKIVVLIVLSWSAAYAQITPSGDSYTNTATPTTNYGSKPLLMWAPLHRSPTSASICPRFPAEPVSAKRR